MMNSKEKALQITLKDTNRNEQYWGSFTIESFNPQIQSLFSQNVSQIYHFLCKQTEEIVVQRDRISIQMDYLKSPLKIQFVLHPMLMFSQNQHDKLMNRIGYLQGRVFSLENQQEEKKLTFYLSQKTVNFYDYQLLNLSNIRPLMR